MAVTETNAAAEIAATSSLPARQGVKRRIHVVVFISFLQFLIPRPRPQAASNSFQNRNLRNVTGNLRPSPRSLEPISQIHFTNRRTEFHEALTGERARRSRVGLTELAELAPPEI